MSVQFIIIKKWFLNLKKKNENINLHDGLGVCRILTIWIFTALAGINVGQHSVSVVILSTAWQINGDLHEYGSFVIGLIFF